MITLRLKKNASGRVSLNHFVLGVFGWTLFSVGLILRNQKSVEKLRSVDVENAPQDVGHRVWKTEDGKKFAGVVIHGNATEEEDDRIYPSNPGNSGCRILVSKKRFDFHYEVFESVALQYPLPWGNMTPQCDSESGLQSNDPIIVDYLLGFNYNDWNLPEGLGWKNYFEKHLQGRRRRRRTRGGDERWIQFGSIVDSTPELVKNISWSSYAANVEINCDWLGAVRLMRRHHTLFCVYHGQPKETSLEPAIVSRICWLNPQHDPNCWFVPSVFPKFPTPPKPFAIPSDEVAPSQNKTRLNVCMSWKSMPRGDLMRDPTVLVDALRSLKPANLRVLVIGRHARVPRQFIDAGVAHYVTPVADKVDFYEYQELISTCHVLVPLLHPEGDSQYFKGRLSGLISLAIGRRIPTLLHSAAIDIYKDELTAFTAAYDTDPDSASFIQAFSRMLDYYNYPQKNQHPSVVLKEPSVPPTLHFIYVPINENCQECSDGKSIHDIISNRSPPKLYDNIIDIIDKYTIEWNSSLIGENNIGVNFLGKDECHEAIQEVEPRLMKHYQNETYGPHRSDICRLAQLYRKGGYYLDNDTKVLKPLVLPSEITFATVIGISKNHFAQGIIFAAPGHPVIRLAIDMTLQHYQGIHARPELDYSRDTGTKVLYDAYHKVQLTDPALDAKSLLLEEVILKRHPLMKTVNIAMKTNINFCTAAFISSDGNEVFMLARAPGTSYC